MGLALKNNRTCQSGSGNAKHGIILRNTLIKSVKEVQIVLEIQYKKQNGGAMPVCCIFQQYSGKELPAGVEPPYKH